MRLVTHTHTHSLLTPYPLCSCDLPKKPKTAYTFFQLSVMDRTWKEIEAISSPGTPSILLASSH
jgi:hypothetical protein